MNHGHQFDEALLTELKAEQKRKQAKREARKKLEAAAPKLLSACEASEEWLPENSDVREQVRKAIKEAGK